MGTETFRRFDAPGARWQVSVIGADRSKTLSLAVAWPGRQPGARTPPDSARAPLISGTGRLAYAQAADRPRQRVAGAIAAISPWCGRR
jgi:hypothetical protein